MVVLTAGTRAGKILTRLSVLILTEGLIRFDSFDSIRFVQIRARGAGSQALELEGAGKLHESMALS